MINHKGSLIKHSVSFSISQVKNFTYFSVNANALECEW